MMSWSKGMGLAGVVAALFAACGMMVIVALVGLAAGCQSHEKHSTYSRHQSDVAVHAPGTAVDVDDDDVYVDAPFVNVRVRR